MGRQASTAGIRVERPRAIESVTIDVVTRRRTYELVAPLAGPDYRATIELGAERALQGLLVVRDQLPCNATTRAVLRRLSPSRTERSDSWPGTTLGEGAGLATLHYFPLTGIALDALFEVSDSIFDRQQPTLPEDLFPVTYRRQRVARIHRPRARGMARAHTRRVCGVRGSAPASARRPGLTRGLVVDTDLGFEVPDGYINWPTRGIARTRPAAQYRCFAGLSYPGVPASSAPEMPPKE